MHKARGAKADSVTVEEYHRRMRGGGNGNGGGGEEPNVVSRWIRQKGREAVEYKMALLDNFNSQNPLLLFETQPLLKNLKSEFDAIVNHEGLQADIAAVKALWHHGLPKSKPSPA